MSVVSPFAPNFESLPLTLPVFPLDGVIVLPGVELPLNVFEPRYLNMVEDALKTHHMFGMIQPGPAQGGAPGDLSAVGCAGRITAYSETADGRVLLSLTGLIRFVVSEELAAIRGYRVVVPDWKPYAGDLEPQSNGDTGDRSRLVNVLEAYLRGRNMEIDWRRLEGITGARLIDMMATLLPIGSGEKQAILEARQPAMREQLLLAALELSLHGESDTPRH